MTQEQLRQELARLQQLLDSYEELECDMETPEYVARGNGFCDAKYSEDFLEGQIAQIRLQIVEIEKQIKMAGN